MTQIKKISVIALMLVSFILIGFFGLYFSAVPASADTDKAEAPVTEIDSDDTAAPYGLMTSLTLSIGGEKGVITASVKNTFTLFPATVRVVVELYNSDTFQESYTTMELVCRNMISDLNMGSTVQTQSSTNGEQKYWKARMYYKIDAKDWQQRETEAVLYGADGIMILP